MDNRFIRWQVWNELLKGEIYNVEGEKLLIEI